jgi:hypothetical protein
VFLTACTRQCVPQTVQDAVSACCSSRRWTPSTGVTGAALQEKRNKTVTVISFEQ